MKKYILMGLSIFMLGTTALSGCLYYHDHGRRDHDYDRRWHHDRNDHRDWDRRDWDRRDWDRHDRHGSLSPPEVS